MQVNARSIRGALLASLALFCAGFALDAAWSAQQAAERITTATGVRVRSGPSADAEELGKLGFGTVITVVDRSAAQATVGGTPGHWLRIAPVDGLEGWVFGPYTTSYESARRGEVVRRIVSERLERENLSFGDLLDLQAFVARAGSGLPAEDRAALELMGLEAIQQAAMAVPIDRQREEPYASWLEEQKDLLVYSEPGGVYLVKPSLYWDGAKRYAGTPQGENWAWAGARAMMPGECEGYLPCHLHSAREMEGRYLELYPNGEHAAEALESLRQLLEAAAAPDSGYETAPEDRQEVARLARELRGIVAKTTSPQKQAVLTALERLAKHHGAS